MTRVGVLSLQGGVEPHISVLQRLGHEAVEVKTRAEMAELDGLVLPGGESSVLLRLLRRYELWDALQGRVGAGLPVLATCAGLILCAREVHGPEQDSLKLLDISVRRNAFGRQLSSFEARDDTGRLPLVFIRAPRIERVGPGVVVLAKHRGEPVLVRQGNLFGATFHPELSSLLEVHRLAFG